MSFIRLQTLSRTTSLLVARAFSVSAPTILPTNESSDQLVRIRHSTAHVLAMAVKKIKPTAQTAIGPWTDHGFFYDFFHPDGNQFSESDLKRIKTEMDLIIKQNLPMTCEVLSREEAAHRIKVANEPFKHEILDSIDSESITVYHIGDEWWDLCAGPHVSSTGELPRKAIELIALSGAFWRGDETKPALQRIHGIAWEHAHQLKQYKQMMKEAEKRDHRVIGKKMDLFSIQEAAGGGLVFWHPKGAACRQVIENFWRKQHEEAGYQILYTPHIANADLWQTSGHLDFYRESMFDQMDVDGSKFQLRPMNCPFHCLVFKNTLRSYRELPVRWAELGTVYRYERSGTMHGLMRVRGFTQDDAHIFCLPSQLTDEIVGVLNIVEKVLSKFGFQHFEVMLSTRPEKSVGEDAVWEMSLDALRAALDSKGWQFSTDEGGGAFYGPKIDIKIRDAIGRLWQCSTIQCDFNLPERFNLEYVSQEGSRERPIMVHRAIFGSLERFFGILLESTAGDLPFWVAPTQIRLLPVVPEATAYCKDIAERARRLGLRVEVDPGIERLSKQVRNAEQSKVPCMGIVGNKEMQEGTLTLRGKGVGDLGSWEVKKVLATAAEASERGLPLHDLLP